MKTIARITRTVLMLTFLMALSFNLMAQSNLKEIFEKVDVPLSLSEMQAALETESFTTREHGDVITFLVKSEADSIKMFGPFRDSFSSLGNDVWALSYRLSELEKSLFRWLYFAYKDGEVIQKEERFFRSRTLVNPYPASKAIKGQVAQHEVHSEALKEGRQVVTYLPPNYDPEKEYPVLYATDGQEIHGLIERIDPLIASGKMTELLIVAAHTAGYDGEMKKDFSDYDMKKDFRSREYNKGFLKYFSALEEEDTRYANHLEFFLNELSDWAEKELGASPHRGKKMVTGASNGGAFVSALTTTHPKAYSLAIINSLSWTLGTDSLMGKAEDYPKYYFSAGKYEYEFLQGAKGVANKIKDFGADVTFTERWSGHDIQMWEEEIIKGLGKYLNQEQFPEEDIEKLESLFEEDQAKRLELNKLQKQREQAREEHGAESEEFKNLKTQFDIKQQEMLLQDARNTEVLEPILQKYGWPHISKTSKLANKSAFFIVQHNFDIQARYLPMILESARKKETPGKWVALLQDRMLMYQGKEQIYGTQLLTLNGEHLIWPIEDDENVDVRRGKMGMKPLAEVLEENYGIEYIRRELKDMPKVTFLSPKKKSE